MQQARALDCKVKIVSISYDGALEPLGQSQVIPYLEGLAREGMGFTLISFEKPADLLKTEKVQETKDRLRCAGIRWIGLRYHKRPTLPATLWDVLVGTSVGLWATWKTGAQIVHARSYIAGAMALLITTITGSKFIFDMRGFWPEERVEGNIWPADGFLYRMSKILEKWLFARADEVVALTEKGREILMTNPYRASMKLSPPVTVIPCCVDTSRFTSNNQNATDPIHSLGLKQSSYLVYAGSLGTWYMLEEMLDFYCVAKNTWPGFKFLFLNRGEHQMVRAKAAEKGLDEQDVIVIEAKLDQVPEYLASAFAGIYFIKPTFSKQGSSPTKLAEYLATGLPVVVNEGVGDTDRFVYRKKVGVVVTHFTRDEYNQKWGDLVGLIQSDNDLRNRCRVTAEAELSLDYGVRKYREIFSRVMVGI